MNVTAIKVQEALNSWLLINISDANVILFPAAFKTQMLGAPDKLAKPQRKKWSIEKAKEIFTLRGDKETLQEYEDIKTSRKQKLCDISDCVIECQAFKLKYFVGNF